jgi:hypothetical protein
MCISEFEQLIAAIQKNSVDVVQNRTVLKIVVGREGSGWIEFDGGGPAAFSTAAEGAEQLRLVVSPD